MENEDLLRETLEDSLDEAITTLSRKGCDDINTIIGMMQVCASYLVVYDPQACAGVFRCVADQVEGELDGSYDETAEPTWFQHAVALITARNIQAAFPATRGSA